MENFIGKLKSALTKYNGEWKEKKGLYEFSTTIAERKAFLAKKKLIYASRLRIDDPARILKFSEMLIESGSGISSGGGFDNGMSTGFGVKTESYNTFGGTRKGTLEEQSKLFGKDYSYRFDFNEIRSKVQDAAVEAGYRFDYQLMPVK
jgi:hypothetical protein